MSEQKEQGEVEKKRAKVGIGWDFWGLWALLFGGINFFIGFGGALGGVITAVLALLIIWKLPKRYRGRKIPIQLSIGFVVAGLAFFVAAYAL